MSECGPLNTQTNIACIQIHSQPPTHITKQLWAYHIWSEANIQANGNECNVFHLRLHKKCYSCFDVSGLNALTFLTFFKRKNLCMPLTHHLIRPISN